MRIDAHQHFWRVSRGDYGWLTADMPVLYRDYEPEDMLPLLNHCKVNGSVLVQAAPTLAETYFLLELAETHPSVKAVVGWVDFEADSAIDDLAKLAQNPKFRGVRPMIQDIDDPNWMLKAEFGPVFEKIIDLSLVFDALVLPRHLENLCKLILRYPSLQMAIDHGAKPNIAAGEGYDAWAEAMQTLCKNQNVMCKVSGLWTEAGGDTSDSNIWPYVDHLFSCFGPQRLMWGSDWPVLNLAGEYCGWFDQCQRFFSTLAEQDKAAIFGGNAGRFYGF